MSMLACDGNNNNNNNNKSTKITIQCRIVVPLFVGMLKLHGFFVWQMSEREKNICLRL